MVTPLGCGVETTWKRLLEGESGIRGITVEDLKMNGFDRDTQLHTFDQLTSKVAAVVPCGTNSHEFNEELWFNSKVIIVINYCSQFKNGLGHLVNAILSPASFVVNKTKN